MFHQSPSYKQFLYLVNDNIKSASVENKEIIVTGHFNCDFLPKKLSRGSKLLKEIFVNYGFTQFIKQAMRTMAESCTLIDLFASTHPSNIVLTKVAISSLSDPMLVVVQKINMGKQQPRIIECRSYVYYCSSVFCNKLRSAPWK